MKSSTALVARPCAPDACRVLEALGQVAAREFHQSGGAYNLRSKILTFGKRPRIASGCEHGGIQSISPVLLVLD